VLCVKDGQSVFARVAKPAPLRQRPTLQGLDVANAEQVFVKLREQKILVKNVGKMHNLLHDCLRVTVSSAEENASFLAAFAASLETT